MNNIVALPPIIHAPAFLRACKGWLLWKLEEQPNGKKPRKVPYYVNGVRRCGVQGSDADRASLATFEAAAAMFRRGGWAGIGFAVLKDWKMVGLDFDACIKDGVLDPIVADLVIGTYAEISPSGEGIHAFMSGVLANKKSRAMNGVFGFETFATSGFLTFTGQVTDDCDMTGTNNTLLPITPEIMTLYHARFGEQKERRHLSTTAADALDELVVADGITLENASVYLTHIDVDDYDEWREAGMALHHQFGGSVEALALWDAWSCHGSKYVDIDDLETRWHKFGMSDRRSVTFRSILQKHNERSVGVKYDAVLEWKTRLREEDRELKIREQICVAIKADHRLGVVERENLASAVKDRLAAIGVKLTIALCRVMVTPAEAKKSELPAWAKKWVYVTDCDKFYKKDSNEWLTMQGFNARFNREMPCAPGEMQLPCAWLLLNMGLETVTRAVYIPWAPLVFLFQGDMCVNLYRPSSPPQAAEHYTPEGRAAINLVCAHINMLVSAREELNTTVLSYFAQNVQHPGVKIRYAPLFKGIEGDGKSLLGYLLGMIMGECNVKNISPKAIGTDFTGWAVGACMGILEEIRLVGHNRHDILNALKPLITNNTIAVHPKGVEEYNAPNTMNYMAFTNHQDALPLTDDDRRWLIIFGPCRHKEDMPQILGCAPQEYFDRLHDAIANHVAEIRKFFLEYKIPASFNPNGPAPDTVEKNAMITSNRSDVESAARNLIEEGAYGVCKEAISSSDLTHALAHLDEPIYLESKNVNALFIKLGYMQVKRNIKWDGKSRRVWLQIDLGMTNKKIIAILDRTRKSSKVDGLNTRNFTDLI